MTRTQPTRLSRRQIESAAAMPSPMGDTFWHHIDAVAIAAARTGITGVRHRVRRRKATMGMHGQTRPWIWSIEPIGTPANRKAHR